MSYLIAEPETMIATASDIASIGSDLSAAHLAAVVPTADLVAAAGDEVSAGIADIFSRYAEDFHSVVGKATAFQGQFVRNLKAGAVAYTSAEDSIASFLQRLMADFIPPSTFDHVHASLLQRAIYHLELLHQAEHEIVTGQLLGPGLTNAGPALSRLIDLLKTSTPSEVFKLALADAGIVIVLGLLLALAIPFGIVPFLFEQFLQHLRSLLP